MSTPRWPLGQLEDVLPPELCADEMVTITVDTSQLTQVVSALVKTIQSQSQCIATLDREFRNRKSDVDARLAELDTRTAADFGMLKQALQTVNDSLSVEVSSQRDALQDIRDSAIRKHEAVLADLTAHNEAIHQLNEQVQRVTADISTIVASIGHAEEAAQQRDKWTREQLKMLAEDADRTAAAVAANHKASEDGLNQINGDVRLVEKQLGSELVAMGKDLADVQALGARLAGDLSHLVAETAAQQQTVHSAVGLLNEEVRRHGADLNSVFVRLEEEEAKRRSDISALATDIGSLHANQGHIAEQLDALHKNTDERILALRANNENISKTVDTLRGFTAQLDSDLSALRDGSEQNFASLRANHDTLRQTLKAVHALAEEAQKEIALLGPHVDGTKHALENLAIEHDEWMALWGLTRATVSQANRAGSQVEALLSTAPFRYMQGEALSRHSFVEHKLEEFLLVREEQNAVIAEKADRELLKKTQEALVTEIVESSKATRGFVDELRQKVSDRLCQMEDLRAQRDDVVDRLITGTRAELDSLRAEVGNARTELEVNRVQRAEIVDMIGRKADIERLMRLTQQQDEVTAKFSELDKVLDSVIYRVTATERELLIQSKQVASRSDLMLLDTQLMEIRKAIGAGYNGSRFSSFLSTTVVQSADSVTSAHQLEAHEAELRAQDARRMEHLQGVRRVIYHPTSPGSHLASPPHSPPTNISRLPPSPTIARELAGLAPTPTVVSPHHEPTRDRDSGYLLREIPRGDQILQRELRDTGRTDSAKDKDPLRGTATGVDSHRDSSLPGPRRNLPQPGISSLASQPPPALTPASTHLPTTHALPASWGDRTRPEEKAR